MTTLQFHAVWSLANKVSRGRDKQIANPEEVGDDQIGELLSCPFQEWHGDHSRVTLVHELPILHGFADVSIFRLLRNLEGNRQSHLCSCCFDEGFWWL